MRSFWSSLLWSFRKYWITLQECVWWENLNQRKKKLIPCKHFKSRWKLHALSKRNRKLTRLACFLGYSSQQKISILTQHKSTYLNYIFKKQREESRNTSLVCRFQKQQLSNEQLSILANVTITSSSHHAEAWDYVQKIPWDCTLQGAYLSFQSLSFPPVTIFSINFTFNSLLEIPFASRHFPCSS